METHQSKFSLGQTFITVGARDSLDAEDILIALRKHVSGNWGDCKADDRAANDQSVLDGSRIFSVYHDRFGAKFWIITEADRSATTILLPSEY